MSSGVYPSPNRYLLGGRLVFSGKRVSSPGAWFVRISFCFNFVKLLCKELQWVLEVLMLVSFGVYPRPGIYVLGKAFMSRGENVMLGS